MRRLDYFLIKTGKTEFKNIRISVEGLQLLNEGYNKSDYTKLKKQPEFKELPTGLLFLPYTPTDEDKA